ncbi:hypothetical protein Peur_016264 [Populus x canadensis]
MTHHGGVIWYIGKKPLITQNQASGRYGDLRRRNYKRRRRASSNGRKQRALRLPGCRSCPRRKKEGLKRLRNPAKEERLQIKPNEKKKKAQNRADEGEMRGSKLSIVMKKMGYKPSSNDGENDIKTVFNNAEK